MSIALTNRVSELERKVAELAERIEKTVGVDKFVEVEKVKADLPKDKSLNKVPRQMCPHCGAKPNYFLHTRSCKGPWQGASR